MSIKLQVFKAAEFIKEHGITPSARERSYGIRDTLFGWAITAFTFTFFKAPLGVIENEISFFVKFSSGCLAIFLCTLFESIFSKNGLSGLKNLLIKDYNETVTHEVHLSSHQRAKYIYVRGIISSGSYIGLNLSGNLFDQIDNSAFFGTDALVYAILASFVFLQKFNVKEWIGIFIAVIGILFVLFFDLNSLSWKFGIASGIAGALSAMLFSITFFISSVVVRHDTPVRITFYNCLIGSVLSLFVLITSILSGIINSGSFVFPETSAQLIKDSIIVGVLYASSVVLFLRAFLYTEPIIIAMLGFSMGFFSFFFQWFFKGTISEYRNIVGSGLISLGCSFLIYEEYLRSLFESKKRKNLKPVYRSSLRHDLLFIENQFHNGKMSKYEYLSEKHEFNKILLEYANLISNSSIERIEISPDTLCFTIQPLDIQIETDGGARSAPFEILNFGSYEPEDESMAYVLIHNGDTILDIGAHIGWYSVNFGKRFPDSEIYSFEPIEYTFNVLKRNIQKNNLSNVYPLNFGLSEQEEEKKFHYFRSGSAISSSENLIGHENTERVKCALKKLDSIVSDLKMKSVDFIKCDVEGSEFSVLRGAQNTIEKFTPIILIELCEEWCEKFHYSSDEIINFLRHKGYEIFIAIDGKLHVSPLKHFDCDSRYNYFFLNQDKHSDLIKSYT